MCTPPTSSPISTRSRSGQHLRDRGYRHSWGIGRHIQGSQIFDYWRDPDKMMFEHYADGDVFDSPSRRVGAAVGQRPGPVGPAGHGRVHRRRDPAPSSPRSGRCGRRATTSTSRPCGAWSGDELDARLARTADGWWLLTPAGLVRLGLDAPTTGALLAWPALDAAVAAAAAAEDAAVPTGSLEVLSPVTAPAPVVAQAVNYRSHAAESGFDPDKSAGLLPQGLALATGPAGDIIRRPASPSSTTRSSSAW